MKAIFKTKCRLKHKHTKLFGKIIFLTILLIIIITSFLLVNFNKKINKNIINIAEVEVNRVIYSFITDRLTNEVLNEETLKDILIIDKNANNEIVSVNFNLDQAYKVLDSVSNVLTKSVKSMENGDLKVGYLDSKMSHETGSMILSIPLGSTLNSSYFYNLGPKVYVKVNFINAVLTNLETKITDYGLNNALVEIFVYIAINNNIRAPFKTNEKTLEYKAVIASLMVEGKVPSMYNGTISAKTNTYQSTS